MCVKLALEETGFGHFFLPSLLLIDDKYEDNMDQIASDISPLYIVPDSGYIATGLFPRLLTALAGVTSKRSSTTWRIPLDDNVLESVCRNQFEFVVNESVHIILSEFAKYIRIDSIPRQGSDAAENSDLHFQIVSTIDVQLQRVVPRWMKEREYRFSFKCSNDQCSSEPLHFFTDQDLLHAVDVTCSGGNGSSLSKSQLVWSKQELIYQ